MHKTAILQRSLIRLVFIGLLDDPIEEIPNISSALGEHADRDHVEHLDGLVHADIELVEIQCPQQSKTEEGHYDVHGQDNSESAAGGGDGLAEGVFPFVEEV
jgi:hypothetical protein